MPVLEKVKINAMIKAARDLTENAAKMQSEASAARRRALTQKGKYRIEGHDSFSNESYNIGFTDDLEYARFFIQEETRSRDMTLMYIWDGDKQVGKSGRY